MSFGWSSAGGFSRSCTGGFSRSSTGGFCWSSTGRCTTMVAGRSCTAGVNRSGTGRLDAASTSLVMLEQTEQTGLCAVGDREYHQSSCQCNCLHLKFSNSYLLSELAKPPRMHTPHPESWGLETYSRVTPRIFSSCVEWEAQANSIVCRLLSKVRPSMQAVVVLPSPGVQAGEKVPNEARQARRDG